MTGGRRVGKTTLMNQCIKRLLKSKNPQNILFIQGDDLELDFICKNIILDCFNSYKKLMPKEDNHKCYVFIDEIQKIENWDIIMKNLFDREPNIKFIISSSSSLKIKKGAIDNLVGRHTHHIIMPFNFNEVIRYKIHENPKKYSNSKKNFEKFIQEDREKIREFFRASINLPKYLKDFFNLMKSKEDSLKVYFDMNEESTNYLNHGGYPEMIFSKQKNEILRSNIENVINSDITKIYSIKNPRIMKRLLVYLAENFTITISIEKCSEILEVDKRTIMDYICYLESSYIVKISENYELSLTNKIRKKVKKIYFIDNGMRNSILNKVDSNFDSKKTGFLAENAANSNSMRLNYKLTKILNENIFYWRNKNKNEIDIIFEYNNIPIPIEVKYQQNIKKTDLTNIKNFLKTKKSPFGILITKNKMEIKENIIILPLWMFLMI